MQIARYCRDAGPRLGLVLKGTVFDLAAVARRIGRPDAEAMAVPAEAGDMKGLLERMGSLESVADFAASLAALAEAEQSPLIAAGAACSLADVTLLNPLPNPGKVLCLAGNYYERGAAHDLDKTVCTPRIFTKPNTSLIGPEEDLRVPPLAQTVVPEIEMAAVIGRRGRDIPLAEAADYICAYTIFNDFSARSLNLAPVRRGQPWDEVFDWLNGKWFDTFGVVGPTLTLKRAVRDPGNLDLVCRVNGKVRDEGNTRNMIFTPADTIAFISQITTLEPGDLIATGTAIHAEVEVPLESGDVVEGEITGLGVLRNRVVRV
jgi:2-keto-4-pentenoate hydratase/2-oxohepta-3-ene-1,7-dioic acid hydratase in catechol pathway